MSTNQTAVVDSTVASTVHPSGINPTIGRVIYVWERLDQVEPYPAIITKVELDGRIRANVMKPATDEDPEPFTFGYEGQLYTAGFRRDTDGPWATWMPYQVGQAPSSAELLKRLEAVEAAIFEIKENQTHRLLSSANENGATPIERVAALEAAIKGLDPSFCTK